MNTTDALRALIEACEQVNAAKHLRWLDTPLAAARAALQQAEQSAGDSPEVTLDGHNQFCDALLVIGAPCDCGLADGEGNSFQVKAEQTRGASPAHPLPETITTSKRTILKAMCCAWDYAEEGVDHRHRCISECLAEALGGECEGQPPLASAKNIGCRVQGCTNPTPTGACDFHRKMAADLEADAREDPSRSPSEAEFLQEAQLVADTARDRFGPHPSVAFTLCRLMEEAGELSAAATSRSKGRDINRAPRIREEALDVVAMVLRVLREWPIGECEGQPPLASETCKDCGGDGEMASGDDCPGCEGTGRFYPYGSAPRAPAENTASPQSNPQVCRAVEPGETADQDVSPGAGGDADEMRGASASASAPRAPQEDVDAAFEQAPKVKWPDVGTANTSLDAEPDAPRPTREEALAAACCWGDCFKSRGDDCHVDPEECLDAVLAKRTEQGEGLEPSVTMPDGQGGVDPSLKPPASAPFPSSHTIPAGGER